MLSIKNLHLENNLFSAPMAGISDIVYRHFAKKFGAGVVCSEMISATALKYNQHPRFLLQKSPDDTPFSMQLFGGRAEDFPAAVRILELAGADIIDLNAGCPVPKVVKQQAGAYLLKTPLVLANIISAIRKTTTLPLTVKVRSGWDNSSINIRQIARLIENEGADAMVVHARTRSQGYGGLADWDIIRETKESVQIPVIGNGDINSPESAVSMLSQTCCDGIMIGRASIGNPWIFSHTRDLISTGHYERATPLATKISTALDHATRLASVKGPAIALKEIRKFLIKYFKCLPHSAHFRARLSVVSNLEELIYILDEIKMLRLE